MRWLIRSLSRLLRTGWLYFMRYGHTGIDLFAEYDSLFD
jgi:hypothetical protein